MHSQNQPESFAQIIHKKKEAKKKQKTQGQSPIEQLDNRTIGEGSTIEINSQEPITQEVEGQLDNRQERIARTRNQVINFEIDEFLFNLLNEGLIVVDFMAYYAKACHTLGIPMMNRLAINSRNGTTPQKLFAYKVKGALTLHYKRVYYNDNSGITSQEM